MELLKLETNKYSSAALMFFSSLIILSLMVKTATSQHLAHTTTWNCPPEETGTMSQT